MLRANGIETLILTGIVTSGVVLSTLRHAADADYRLLVAAIAARTATRKRIGAIGEGLPRQPPSRRRRDSRRPSGWAIDAVTAPYPSHRQALSLSSTERSRACRFREYDIFQIGHWPRRMSVPSFVSTILLARS